MMEINCDNWFLKSDVVNHQNFVFLSLLELYRQMN